MLITVEGSTKNGFKRNLTDSKLAGVSLVAIIPEEKKEQVIYIDLQKLPPETDWLTISVKELADE